MTQNHTPEHISGGRVAVLTGRLDDPDACPALDGLWDALSRAVDAGETRFVLDLLA